MATNLTRTARRKKRNTAPVNFNLTYGKLQDYEVKDDPYWVKHKRKHQQFTRAKATIQRTSQHSVLCIAAECPTKENNTWVNRQLYAQWVSTHHKNHHSGEGKNFICVSWLEIEKNWTDPETGKKKQRYTHEYALVDTENPFVHLPPPVPNINAS